MSSITQLLEEASSSQQFGFGLEFFCPDTDDGFEDLRQRMDRLAATEPLYVDFVTVGGLENARRALRLCRYAKKVIGLTAVLHFSCADMSLSDVNELLAEAKRMGVTNLLVERGASVTARPRPRTVPPATAGSSAGGGGHSTAGMPTFGTPQKAVQLAGRPLWTPAAAHFQHAADLIRHIRAGYGDVFCVGAAAFPTGYGEYDDAEAEMAQLLEKQAAGASFVFAQHCNEARDCIDFIERARAAGVSLPIIPSVMPVQTYDTFLQVNAYAGVSIPPALAASLQSLQEDNKAVREYGNRLVVAQAKELLDVGVPVLNFHTLNLEVVIRSVLQDLGLCGPGSSLRRKLPWRPSGDESRAYENVRPIFWANRPASYVERTAGWQAFPSGRWETVMTGGGQAFDTPAPSSDSNVSTVEERRRMWGESLTSERDVWDVFGAYMEGRVPRLPWCDATMHMETSAIQSELQRLNHAGFLTINSQPRVNGARSDDSVFGWGGSGGYVYQKAYIECFASPLHLAALMEACALVPSINYLAADIHGNTYSNYQTHGPQAVTWGVFPGKEIMQPTVVDPAVFSEWKVEAFDLWLAEWACIYDEDSTSQDVLHEIASTYYLISVVDNDFIRGNIFKVFQDAAARLREMIAASNERSAMYGVPAGGRRMAQQTPDYRAISVRSMRTSLPVPSWEFARVAPPGGSSGLTSPRPGHNHSLSYGYGYGPSSASNASFQLNGGASGGASGGSYFFAPWEAGSGNSSGGGAYAGWTFARAPPSQAAAASQFAGGMSSSTTHALHSASTALTPQMGPVRAIHATPPLVAHSANHHPSALSLPSFSLDGGYAARGGAHGAAAGTATATAVAVATVAATAHR